MIMLYYIYILFINMVITLVSPADLGLSKCLQVVRIIKPKYHFTKGCATSNMRSLASSNASDAEQCARLAESNNAFAFAYTNITEGVNITISSTCVVFECPEYHGFLTSSIADQSLYNYYSAYSKPLPNENYTCIPGLGVFDIITNRMNYSDAIEACIDAGGHLANIVSDTRTSLLASLVSSALTNYTTKHQRAFVGLFFDEHFVTITGEPLACLPYRAWAPGHPKSRKIKKDCVVLTSNRYWETEDCSKNMPFICELIADGPMSAVERYCAPIKNHRRRKNCIVRNYKQFEQIEQTEQQCIDIMNNSVGT
ncbi:uncharacterized protein LOC126899644 isoform X1 [Daktulosphaira vitifoliae]|uniref:uncharacterized protein LOC126899644 isoform X1 n=1 Tax=Daktulosphaira vitifoliae TaxID=58002 RepID=UPI0021AAD07E|nr:uncharacterized protein LOC126899644 isoform X1 [Daktulosphaira vitifoliae]